MENEIKDLFPVIWQRTLLSKILKDKFFCNEARKIIKSEYFESITLRWIWNQINDNKIITQEILVDILKRERKNEKINVEIFKAIVEELKIIVKLKDFDNADYYLEKVKEFALVKSTTNALFNAANNIKNGLDIKYINNQLRKTLFDSSLENEIETVEFVDNYDLRSKEREEALKNGNVIFIPFGIDKLDEEIEGQMLGELFSFFGDTNMGKSAFATNIGKARLLRGYRTWHIITEDKLDMTLQRYDTSISEINYKKFTKCTYDENEKERLSKIFKLLNERRKGYLYISKLEDGCTFADIISEYEKLKYIKNFIPQSIILDSPHCMEPIQRRENSRLNYKQIYLEARGFARRENIAIVLLDQSKQEVKGKIADTGAASESYDKARIVDGFITINQTRMQAKEGIMELFVAKMKRDKKRFSIMMRPRLEIMKFESIN